jgi:hypothetical protein
MQRNLDVSPDGAFIILTIKGDINRRLAMRYNREAHALGKQLGMKHYLVDATESRNVETTFDNYAFAYDDMTAASEIDRSARVALLVSPGDHTHDFVETVSRNAGLDVTLFIDRTLAEAHLRKR